jgi:hypothetical protein
MLFNEELFALSIDHATSAELPALKKRFEGFDICKDKATAAAFGYLAAMRDAEREENEEQPSVYDKVCAVMDKLDDPDEWMRSPDEWMTSEDATETVFALIYLWLKQELIEEGLARDFITFLDNKFKAFVKPGVINQSR